ncbi:hypothetical protein [Saccharothrix sp.]|uniref:hypothetical protein n=1 Tax=Saccharothrix sp. TaxID=1873460 RepID=UPI00281267E2|nr:hypothetical protein [Saccharothrix sp.]
MAVDRALWWSVWWPWAVVWLVTALAVPVALGVFVLAWRSRRRFVPTREVPGLTVYLNAKYVMDLYQVGGFGDAVVKEVVDRVGTTKDGKIALPGLSESGLGVSSGREVVKTYLERFEPITVVGVLMDALDRIGEVVRVDLEERTVTRNAVLDRVAHKAREVRLRKLKSYVLVKGEFELAEDAPVLTAPIGDTGDVVRVECQEDGLDPNVPDGPFDAICLGRVQAWRGGSRELVVRPIAVFQ